MKDGESKLQANPELMYCDIQRGKDKSEKTIIKFPSKTYYIVHFSLLPDAV